MICTMCGQRKARRACPALARQICTVCCGTKRLVEIRCPDSCGYLAAARQHPPAALQRQYEYDLAALRSTLVDLSEPQQQLCLLFLSVVASHGAAESLDRVVDGDVIGAAGAFAGTLETAAKGLIYEHQAPSRPAQRLVTGFREALDRLAGQAPARGLERDASLALRGIERGARDVQGRSGDGPRAYIEVVRRVIRPYESVAAPQAQEPDASRLIAPGML